MGRGSSAGTLGVPLGGPRRVGGLLGVAGRLSGTVSLKESACNAGDLGSIPGSGRSPEEGMSATMYRTPPPPPTLLKGAYNAGASGDSGSIPGSGRSLGGGDGNPL